MVPAVAFVAAVGGMFYALGHSIDQNLNGVSNDLLGFKNELKNDLKGFRNELKVEIQGIGDRMDALLIVLVGEAKAEAIKMATAPVAKK